MRGVRRLQLNLHWQLKICRADTPIEGERCNVTRMTNVVMARLSASALSLHVSKVGGLCHSIPSIPCEFGAPTGMGGTFDVFWLVKANNPQFYPHDMTRQCFKQDEAVFNASVTSYTMIPLQPAMSMVNYGSNARYARLTRSLLNPRNLCRCHAILWFNCISSLNHLLSRNNFCFSPGVPLDSSTMYQSSSLTWSTIWLFSLQASSSSASSFATIATPSLQALSTASPICLQPRRSTDPVAATIQSSVIGDNSIAKACTSSTQQIGVIPSTHTFYTFDNSYYFNTSLQNLSSTGNSSGTPSSYPGSQICVNNLNAIFSACVIGRNFWGGWTESHTVNYTSQ